jgi:hypothetical protein
MPNLQPIDLLCNLSRKDRSTQDLGQNHFGLPMQPNDHSLHLSAGRRYSRTADSLHDRKLAGKVWFVAAENGTSRVFLRKTLDVPFPRWQEQLQAPLRDGAEVVTLDVVPKPPASPWVEFAGMFKDDPLYPRPSSPQKSAEWQLQKDLTAFLRFVPKAFRCSNRLCMSLVERWRGSYLPGEHPRYPPPSSIATRVINATRSWM